MKNVKDASKTIVKDAKNEIVKINLDQFKDQLSSIQLKEKKERSTIYLYPEGKGKEWINSPDGKKWRNNKRNSIQRFANNILIFAKSNQLEKLQEEIKKFDAFYKEFYRLNDYSFASISNSNDAKKEGDIDLMMKIIKEIKK